MTQSEVKSLRAELLRAEENLVRMREMQTKTADLEQVELLGVVIEEQRIRIDAIIQGSTKILPIYNTLQRFEEQLRDALSFLALPQPKSLNLQLDEIRNHIQGKPPHISFFALFLLTVLIFIVLKDDISVSREFFESEAKLKLESLEYQTNSLGKHFQVFLSHI
jgi:hypothetical protein